LAGVQNHLLDLGQVAIWSEQLQHVANPMTIDAIEIQDLEIGWNVSLADGSRVILKQPQLQPSTPQSQSQLDPLEVWLDDECIGFIELICRENEAFEDMCKNLHELGIAIHIISDTNMTDEPQNKTHFDLALLQRYQHIVTADERLGLVQQLQANGDGVAYIGHVLDDVPGLVQADVSFGINIDPGSIFSLDICDISIEAGLNWLPRIIELSKNLDHTTITNFGLIGVTNLVVAVASAAAWINPLTVVLLSDIPLVIVEIRNINSMHFHRKLTTP
jgi:cation transport ATPase